MPATNWTEANQDATGWVNDTYMTNPSDFVLVEGVVLAVDADGNNIPTLSDGAAVTWTEATVSATSWTEASGSATVWTEATG